MSYEELLERYPNKPIPAPSSVIVDLPVYLYKVKTKGMNGGEKRNVGGIDEDDHCDCLVCLEKFTENEELKMLPCTYILPFFYLNRFL